ncbi:MAG TPA: hypothetical protein V6C81_08780 [Planktothrix sp.]
MTFSLPMVSHRTTLLSSVASVPVRIQPQPAGRWHWLDEKSLVFEPAGGRLPYATFFRGSVSADASAINGCKIAHGVDWNFATDRPEISGQNCYASGQAFSLYFNQPVSPRSILAHSHLRVGAKTYACRPATSAECTEFLGGASPGFYTFVPMEPLPEKQRGSVDVDAGIESPEGPLRTTNTRHLDFFTENPGLHLWQPFDTAQAVPVISDFPPDRPLVFLFERDSSWKKTGPDGPIKVDQLDTEMIHVTPEIAHMSLNWAPNKIIISGDTQPDTTYTVVFSKNIPGYDCTLGSDQVVIVKTSSSTKKTSQPVGSIDEPRYINALFSADDDSSSKDYSNFFVRDVRRQKGTQPRMVCTVRKHELLPGEETTACGALVDKGSPRELVPLVWCWYAAPVRFMPGGWPGFSFGAANPPDQDRDGRRFSGFFGTLKASSGDDGQSWIRFSAQQKNCHSCLKLKVQCDYRTKRNEDFASDDYVLLQPSALTVGLKPHPGVGSGNEIDGIDFVVTNLKGEPVKGSRVQFMVREKTHSTFDTSETKVLQSHTEVSENGPRFAALDPFDYQSREIVAQVKDTQGRLSETIISSPTAEPADLVGPVSTGIERSSAGPILSFECSKPSFTYEHDQFDATVKVRNESSSIETLKSN